VAIRIGQKGPDFMERGNLEYSNRTNELQPVTHGLRRIEQLELNVMVTSPFVQKHQDA
jgi:hypothetical protein